MSENNEPDDWGLVLHLLAIAAQAFCAEHPERATPELLYACERFNRWFGPYRPVEPRRTCKWCGHTIQKRGDRWVHDTGERGCRAASHWRLGGQGWDDSLKRSWTATPA